MFPALLLRRLARSATALAMSVGAALHVVAIPAVAGPLTLAVANNPMSLPVYVAAREGYFGAEGLDVRLLDCPTGARCLAIMLDGGADLATAADTPLVFRSFERSDFMLVGTFASATDDAKMITRKDTGIERPRQLAGRRIAVTRGTSNHYYLDAFLLMHGMDTKSVEVVSMAPEQMGDALASGRVDAISTFEPHAWRALQKLKDNGYRLPSSALHTVTFNLVAPRAMAGTRDTELAAVLRALERAQQFIREQPARAQRVLAERLGTDQGFIDALWPTVQYRLRLEQSLIKTMESEARWALRERYVRNDVAPNYLGFIYAAPLRSTLPAAVSIGAVR